MQREIVCGHEFRETKQYSKRLFDEFDVDKTMMFLNKTTHPYSITILILNSEPTKIVFLYNIMFVLNNFIYTYI